MTDGSDTPWTCVGQPWAGTTWGRQVIPRIGMEAVVSYQEGDPDRPFITAVLPDPTNPVPYTLPDNKTRMVFRSKSYKSSGNNEMTFEDATGGENQFFNASKDQTTNVTNNATTSIAANESNSIGQNQSTTIGSNATTEVGGSMNISVGGAGAGALQQAVDLYWRGRVAVPIRLFKTCQMGAHTDQKIILIYFVVAVAKQSLTRRYARICVGSITGVRRRAIQCVLVYP